MIKKPISELTGKNLYYSFVAGGQRLIANQTEINLINVFPVNDQDTGTNLASTIRAILDQITPEYSYKTTFNHIAEAALIGARGNSGVIFAQFLYGMNMETPDKEKIDIHEFIKSIKNAINFMYQAVATPMEGTMLTVIREWSENISQSTTSDFNHLFINSINTLKKSLTETTQKLKILSQNNVVDAGAKGFVVFIEGIIDFILNSDIRKISSEISAISKISHIDEIDFDEINYRFCTEAIIRNLNISTTQLTPILEKYGDSIVVAGSDKIARVHVHTNNPADLFAELRPAGTISMQKVDDMQRQHEIIRNRKWNIAIVTDSTCDLSQELIDKYQIHVLPLSINFGENQYLDKVTISPNQFYKLLDESPVFPTSSQINERTFTNQYANLASHYDAIVAIHLTQQFSGTFLSSQKAADKISKEFQKPIMVIDSKTLSGALGLIVLRTAEAIENGISITELKPSIERWIEQSEIYVSVKTLKYMVKGGRVSHTKGLISKLLNINPIVTMDKNGKSMVFGKAFTHRSNMKKVLKQIKVLTKTNALWNYIILHANNEDGAHWLANEMRKQCGKDPVSFVNISPVIGMNAGIGTTSIALLTE
ncbi:MAG: DegV family protein [Bacteroidota bacterium]